MWQEHYWRDQEFRRTRNNPFNIPKGIAHDIFPASPTTAVLTMITRSMTKKLKATSHLMRLPRELRDAIWAHAIQPKDPNLNCLSRALVAEEVQDSELRRCIYQYKLTPSIPNLARVSRQVRDEVLSIPYTGLLIFRNTDVADLRRHERRFVRYLRLFDHSVGVERFT